MAEQFRRHEKRRLALAEKTTANRVGFMNDRATTGALGRFTSMGKVMAMALAGMQDLRSEYEQLYGGMHVSVSYMC
jgi:hypothetical protein